MSRAALSLGYLTSIAAELHKLDAAGWVVEERGIGHVLTRASFTSPKPGLWAYRDDDRARFSGCFDHGVARPWDNGRWARFDASVALSRPVTAAAEDLYRRLVRRYLAAFEASAKDKRSEDRATADGLAAMRRIAAEHPRATVETKDDRHRVSIGHGLVVEWQRGAFTIGRNHCGLGVSERVAAAVLRELAAEEAEALRKAGGGEP